MMAVAAIRSVYDLLMRVSVPLLLALTAVAVLAIPPTFKWASTAGKLRKAEAQAAAQNDVLARTRGELTACQGDADRLTAALETQNAAIDAMKAESDARTTRANAAIRRAQEQNRALQGKIVRLERARATDDVCMSAQSLIVETLREDRS